MTEIFPGRTMPTMFCCRDLEVADFIAEGMTDFNVYRPTRDQMTAEMLLDAAAVRFGAERISDVVLWVH